MPGAAKVRPSPSTDVVHSARLFLGYTNLIHPVATLNLGVETLVDVEENFQMWRFRHMKAVERIIGYRLGTGGSSGVGFLKKALELTFFPELLEVRTQLRAA
jgi:tryptophan 2,3-dioxygenase